MLGSDVGQEGLVLFLLPLQVAEHCDQDVHAESCICGKGDPPTLPFDTPLDVPLMHVL